METLKLDMKNGKVFGVCAGLANYLEADVAFIRLAFVLSSLFTHGFPCLIYLVLAFILDKEV